MGELGLAMRADSDRQGLADLLAQMADGLGKLFTQHVALAKLELLEDAKKMGSAAALVLAFLPFIGLGYAFLCGAAAVALTPRWGLGLSLLAVAGANLVVGAVGVTAALIRMRQRNLMGGSVDELSKSAAVFSKSTLIAGEDFRRDSGT